MGNTIDLGSALMGIGLLGFLGSLIAGLFFVGRPSVFVEIEFGPNDQPYVLTVINPGPLEFLIRALTATPDGFGGYYLDDSPLFREKRLARQGAIRFQVAREMMGPHRDFQITYSPVFFGKALPIRMHSRHRFDPQAHSVTVVASFTMPIEWR